MVVTFSAYSTSEASTFIDMPRQTMRMMNGYRIAQTDQPLKEEWVSTHKMLANSKEWLWLQYPTHCRFERSSVETYGVSLLIDAAVNWAR